MSFEDSLPLPVTTVPGTLLKPTGPFTLLQRSEQPPSPRPVYVLHPPPGQLFPSPLLGWNGPFSERRPPPPHPEETPRRQHLMSTPCPSPRERASKPRESLVRVSACSRPSPPLGCLPLRAAPARLARRPAHRACSVNTCRRAKRPPRPLGCTSAPLSHSAAWLAHEHDCLELIRPRGWSHLSVGTVIGPTPSECLQRQPVINATCHSWLAARGLSANAAPVHETDARSLTGLTLLGAARPQLRGSRKAGDAAEMRACHSHARSH